MTSPATSPLPSRAQFLAHPDGDTNRFLWSPSPRMFTPMGTLQGGAGLAAAIAAMEAVTERPLVWATSQYLAFGHRGDEPFELAVAVEVAGHRTTQARCILSRGDLEIATTHGALGARRIDTSGTWESMPEVAAPDACERYAFFESGRGHLGDLVELRLARGRQLADLDGTAGDGSLALWVRCWTGERDVTVADLAFIGDFMPLGFAAALGAPYAGNSLDNTVRVGEPARTDWVLLSIHVHQVANGFGHGRAELWARDGTLLGQVSQSAAIRLHTRIREMGGDR